MPAYLDNPKTVSWSHSDRTADFYELPTDGAEMQEALHWLLQRYDTAKLWMGVETGDGVELFLTCFPSRRDAVVDRLRVYDDEFSVFEDPRSAAVGAEL